MFEPVRDCNHFRVVSPAWFPSNYLSIHHFLLTRLVTARASNGVRRRCALGWLFFFNLVAGWLEEGRECALAWWELWERDAVIGAYRAGLSLQRLRGIRGSGAFVGCRLKWGLSR
jgi:hypothetical protein